jgi:hypothetical protein
MKMKPRFVSLIGVMLLAAMMRILPHPWNFTPIAAMALFGGAEFDSKIAAFFVPLGTLFLSDVILGFYSRMWLTYGCFALVVCIGILIKERKTSGTILVAALLSSISFFILTNLGVWFFDGLYPRTMPGLWTCYIAALPFFQHTLLGDLTYTAVLFGAFHLAERRFPALQVAR